MKRTCVTCRQTKPLTSFRAQKRKRRSGPYLYTPRECRACGNQRRVEWGKTPKGKEADKQYSIKLKMKWIQAYGGHCVCCGEFRRQFLTVQHIHGGGTVHREQVGWGNNFLRYLQAAGWPKDKYTIYCMNCNFAERHGERCPHKTELSRDGFVF